MPPPKSNVLYFNAKGEPLGSAAQMVRHEQELRKARATEAQATEGDNNAPVQPADLETVFDVLCLAGSWRGKTWVMNFLRGLEWKREDGNAFTPADVASALRALVAAQRVKEIAGQGFAALPSVKYARLPMLLARSDAPRFWRAWLWAGNGAVGKADAPQRGTTLRSDDERVALMRLVLVSGIEPDEYNRMSYHVLGSAATATIVLRALTDPFDAAFIERITPSLLWGLLVSLESGLAQGLDNQPELLAWIDAALQRDPQQVPDTFRLRLAERRLHLGDAQGMRAAIAGSAACADFAPLLEAAHIAWQGRWVEASEAFALAMKDLAKTLGRRRDLAPPSLLQWYALSLLAQHTPSAWTTARKLCVAESGSRTPSPQHGWGLWAHAVAVRLGDEPCREDVFAPNVSKWAPFDASDNADRLLLAAWLDIKPKGWTPSLLAQTAAGLDAAGLPWKAELVRQACTRLQLAAPPPTAGAVPWPVRFFGEPQEAWRDALAAIVALGDGRPAPAAEPAATLRWRLTLDSEGRVDNIEAFEHLGGSRGKGRVKPLTLTQLKNRARLDTRDAAVARCLRAPVYAPRELSFDVTAAAAALVGHPDIVFAAAPEQTVELHESLPTLEVRREKRKDGTDCFVFRLEEALIARTGPSLAHHALDMRDEAEAERRNALRIVTESTDRARLIRIGPAQRRVAELVAKNWAVPVDAQAELDAALRVLSGHFVLHSDAAGGQAVAAESRLRAQFLPRGEALELRLVARPFGEFGPTLSPGAGRARLITMHQGLSLATERALGEERGHLQAVLEALPFLGEAGDDASWLLEDPEQALAAVQALGSLPAVAALEWPRGQPLHVLTPPKGLQLTVRSGRDWFALDGELVVDEQRVFGLAQLLALLRGAPQGRFVALGDGQYLALTERLRQQLADLDALGAADGNGVRVPTAAAAWLADTFEQLDARGDAAWKRRLARLDEAAALQPELPAALQAQLRPYQADGHAWLTRLAHAGFGACLADDMGLGKTVQTLALLLDRAGHAGGGPALVIAPTSVCANWVAEAARFAPTLRVFDYGSGERETLLAQAAAGDVVVASYALVLRDAEAFAARAWGTLVLDEAQALKNAATKRVQAVAKLDAGFRLALTGTPVENRLADLWSIMGLLNPGLLGSAARFAERFANPIERERNDVARARLRRLVGPFFLRRTKAQVLPDLPPRTEMIHRVTPGADELAFLEAARRAAVERVESLDASSGEAAFNVLAELTRLRRAACDPRLVAPELGLIGAKTQEFERLAVELIAGQHKALVFSQFTDFLKLLGQRLQAAGIAYQYLDGATPAEQRAQRVAAFQRGEGELFLISLKAGGFGLNLTAADYVIIADPWWNPAAEDQAMGRAHRIGQQRPVTVYRLVTAGSIEERIVELHRDKRALADGLLEGQDSAAPLRATELMALLRG